MTFWQGKTIDRDSQVTGWQLLRAVGGGWPQRRENFLGNGNILYLDYDGSFPYCIICQNIFRSCCMHAQLWLILCDPIDCSPPGSSVHGILQARVLEWVAMPSSRGSSQPRDQTRASCVSCTDRQIPYLLRDIVMNETEEFSVRGSLGLLWPKDKKQADKKKNEWQTCWMKENGVIWGHAGRPLNSQEGNIWDEILRTRKSQKIWSKVLWARAGSKQPAWQDRYVEWNGRWVRARSCGSPQAFRRVWGTARRFGTGNDMKWFTFFKIVSVKEGT